MWRLVSPTASSNGCWCLCLCLCIEFVSPLPGAELLLCEPKLLRHHFALQLLKNPAEAR